MTGNALRTADGALRARWRLAAFGAAVVAAATVIGAIGFGVAAFTPIAAAARAARVPLDQVLSAISVVVATWLTGRVVQGDRFNAWRYSGLGSGSWAPRTLIAASVAGTLVIVVPSVALVAGGLAHFERSVTTDGALTVAWAAFALMVPAAIVEEVLFRGYAFTVCTEAIGARGAVVVTSILFALAHLFNPGPTVASLTAVACAGAFLAIVRLTTGSLVAAFAAHFWVNFAQAVFLHAPVSGLALQMPGYRFVATGPDWLTGGSWGPEAGAGAVAAVAVASFLYIRRRGAARTSTPAETP